MIIHLDNFFIEVFTERPNIDKNLILEKFSKEDIKDFVYLFQEGLNELREKKET